VDATGSLFDRLGHVLLTPERAVDPERLVSVAAQVMPHCHHAGITLVRGDRRPQTIAATDDLPLRVDALQYTKFEGPCLEAAAGHDLVVSDDLRVESRWPMFSGECARRLRVVSMLSVRLSLSSEDRAALNFYSRAAGAFDDDDAGTASLLAPYAALAVEQELHLADVSDLEQALANSRQIGRAVGILMVRYGVTADRAFEMLRTASKHLNRSLCDLTLDVTDIGELPDGHHRRPGG
jgi:GAF domain-containing protein